MNPVPVDATSSEGYWRGVAQVEHAARLVLASDVAVILERIDKAHAVAPNLHPSLYRDGLRQAGQIEALVRAAYRFRCDVLAIVGEAAVPPPARPTLSVVQ